MTASRRAPWPTSGAMLMAPPASSQRLEILAEARPVPGDPADVPVVRPVVQRFVAVSRAERRRRHAAVARDVRGDPLPHHGIRPRILQDGDVGVRVRIDEAGSDVAAAGVDDGAAAQRARRADGGDAVAAHGHVAVVPGVAAAVHDAAIGDDEVVRSSRAFPALHLVHLIGVLAGRAGADVDAALVQVADHAAHGHALVGERLASCRGARRWPARGGIVAAERAGHELHGVVAAGDALRQDASRPWPGGSATPREVTASNGAISAAT